MTRYKRGQGSCSLNCCDEEGISPGAACIQMTPAEISFSMQLLKIQEPCPPFHMVALLLDHVPTAPFHSKGYLGINKLRLYIITMLCRLYHGYLCMGLFCGGPQGLFASIATFSASG